MTGLARRIAWNVRHRWRRIFGLLVVGAGVLTPIITGIWWTLPLIWFLGLFIVLPVLHTLARPIPESAGQTTADESGDDPALDALRERYARGEIDEREFERRLDRLLETEDIERTDRDESSVTGVRRTLEREIERIRE